MRRILRVSGLMGVASAANIATGVVRAKLIALLAGAEGIGLFGLFQAFQGLAATVAGLGLPASGVREVAFAHSRGEAPRLAALRQVLLGLPLATGVVAMAAIWLAREPIARLFFADPDQAAAAGILGIGVAALTVGLVQISWINGFRRIARLAWLKVLTAIAGAALSVALIWRLGLGGVALAVAAASLAGLILALAYGRGLGPREPKTDGLARRAAGRSLLRLGLPLMLAGLLTPATHLVVRSLVLRKLGGEGLGHFQAAWSVSMIYVGFVLASMAVDYLPRLTAHAAEPRRMARLVDEQARAALLLACPVVLAMLALAPLVVRVLYSREFEPAAAVLSWQLVGDFFKVPSWALATVFAALGRGGSHFAAEALWNLPYLAMIWLGVERWGLPFCGVAFLVAYALYFGALWLSMRKLIRFTWSGETLGLLAAGLGAAAAVKVLAGLGTAGIAGQAAIVLGFSLFSFARIRHGLATGEDE